MSVRSEIIHGLKQFTERSVELMREIKSISTGEGGAESPENIMNLLLQTDTMLQAAMASLRRNQDVQQRIELLESKIRSREADVMDLAVQLRSAETILQQALNETAPCVSAIKQAQEIQGSVNVHDLINYSSKVAYTSGKINGANLMEPFPNSELFPYTRLFKALIQRKEETATMEVVEADIPYTSFLGDLGTAVETNDEELADF